ncbi:MAG: TonB-dependent receptor, partial [Desulfatitalea sp.]|nr:TonB-dependent receptor [Desulfatitalea sp.]
GLIFTLLSDRLDLFANYGKGFALLPGFSEQAAFKQKDWEPQQRVQYEMGVRGRPLPWISAEIIGFRLETSKDFIENDATGDYDNVGKTTRDGVEVGVDINALNHGYLHADYGFVNATEPSGNTLRRVPESIYNVEVGYSPPAGIGGRLRYHYEDGYYLDDDNQHKSDGWDRVDAQLCYRFGRLSRYLAAIDIVNLLDEQYADYTGYVNLANGGAKKTYSPALPFSVYATFVIDF